MKLQAPMKCWYDWKGITYVIDMEGRRYEASVCRPEEVQDGLQKEEEGQRTVTKQQGGEQ